MILFHLLFLFARAFDQKLGSSLIYLFYLCTTIQPKLGAILTLKFIIFLIVSILCLRYSWQYCPYVSLSLFLAVFPRYNRGSTTSTFRPLYSLSTALYFAHNIHRSAVLIFLTLYLCLTEVLANLLLLTCLVYTNISVAIFFYPLFTIFFTHLFWFWQK